MCAITVCSECVNFLSNPIQVLVAYSERVKRPQQTTMAVFDVFATHRNDSLLQVLYNRGFLFLSLTSKMHIQSKLL